MLEVRKTSHSGQNLRDIHQMCFCSPPKGCNSVKSDLVFLVLPVPTYFLSDDQRHCYVTARLPPNPTLTLTCHQLTVVGVRGGVAGLLLRY